MTRDLNTPPSKPLGITRRDSDCIARLLKAGQLATAVKLYRSACGCSVEEAELKISDFTAQINAGGPSLR